MASEGYFGVTLELLWGHFGVTLGSFWDHFSHMTVTLGSYLSHFDVEKHSMATLMRMCAGLVGPKSEHVEISLVLKAFLKGQGSHGNARESLRPSGPDR